MRPHTLKTTSIATPTTLAQIINQSGPTASADEQSPPQIRGSRLRRDPRILLHQSTPPGGGESERRNSKTKRNSRCRRRRRGRRRGARGGAARVLAGIAEILATKTAGRKAPIFTSSTKYQGMRPGRIADLAPRAEISAVARSRITCDIRESFDRLIGCHPRRPCASTLTCLARLGSWRRPKKKKKTHTPSQLNTQQNKK